MNSTSGSKNSKEPSTYSRHRRKMNTCPSSFLQKLTSGVLDSLMGMVWMCIYWARSTLSICFQYLSLGHTSERTVANTLGPCHVRIIRKLHPQNAFDTREHLARHWLACARICVQNYSCMHSLWAHMTSQEITNTHTHINRHQSIIMILHMREKIGEDRIVNCWDREEDEDMIKTGIK